MSNNQNQSLNQIADPGPLGLAGFGITTLVLSSINAHIIPDSLLGVVLVLALVYGGTAQLLAGMWEFKKNNTFGATAFTSYGAFWISFFFLVYLQTNHTIDFGKDGHLATGIFLTAWTIFTFYMWLGSFHVNKALLAVFSALLVTFILLDFAEFGVMDSAFGGVVGIITALLALYTSAAGVINSVAGRTVLSVGAKASAPSQQSERTLSN